MVEDHERGTGILKPRDAEPDHLVHPRPQGSLR